MVTSFWLCEPALVPKLMEHLDEKRFLSGPAGSYGPERHFRRRKQSGSKLIMTFGIAARDWSCTTQDA